MITIQLRAGMWNQMFEYAFGKVLAKKYNTSLCLDLKYLQDHWPYKKILKETPRNYDINSFKIRDFNITNKSIHNYALWPFGEMRNFIGKIYNNIYQKIVWLPIIREGKFGFDAKYFDNWPDQYVIWYRQSYKYFESIDEELKEEFTPKNIPSNINKVIEDLSKYETICVNVRRWDFLVDSLLKSKWSDYYFAWLNHITNKIKNKKKIHIVVISDDIFRCEKNLKFKYTTIYLKSDTAWDKNQLHRWIMSHCKNFVWSNSSYLWRSIWRNRNNTKNIVLPKEWFSDNSFDDSHIIPDYRNAIRI